VEAVLGMVDMAGYLFKGLALAGDAVNNAQKLVPQALEMMDELVQAVMQTDFSELISAAAEVVQQQLSTFNIMTMVNAISIERTAYYVGGFIGFVVEIVAGMLYSGGVASITSVIQKLGKFGNVGAKVLAHITSTTTRTFGAAAAFSFEYIMAIVKKMTGILRKGKEEVAKFIEDIFRIIREAGQLADEIIQEIIRKFGFTDEELDAMKKLDFVFTKDNNASCTICNLLN
jgi:vacuolar-type H+-ATPase subunit H